MEYYRFFKDNKHFISFGIILTFFSSFGQTFLISLYVPDLLAMLGLTNASFGGLYSGATITGALMLIYAGRLIDRIPLRTYSVATAVALLLSCIVLAIGGSAWSVALGLFGLRFAGQGMMAHIVMTSMSRYYEEHRGKALSLSLLGFSLGEAVFPVSIGFILGLYGWRTSLYFSAALIVFMLIPMIYWLLRYQPDGDEDRDEHSGIKMSYRELIADRRFFIISVNGTLLPFMLTGLMFYQLILAAQKGWSIEWIATCFVGFAAARTVGSLLSGPLVDRFSAQRLFPLYLIPFVLGVLALAFFSHPYTAMLYLSLAGFAMGLSASIKSAVIAEIYGTRYIGSIRSVFGAMTVVSTAVSPILIGWLLDIGWDFSLISLISAAAASAVVWLSFFLKSNEDTTVAPQEG
jgi:MFS family permease